MSGKPDYSISDVASLDRHATGAHDFGNNIRAAGDLHGRSGLGAPGGPRYEENHSLQSFAAARTTDPPIPAVRNCRAGAGGAGDECSRAGPCPGAVKPAEN